MEKNSKNGEYFLLLVSGKTFSVTHLGLKSLFTKLTDIILNFK